MSNMLGGKPKIRPQGLYDRANLQRAYIAHQKGMSVYKAARIYKVPETTLRDRTSGRIDVDTVRPGPAGILSYSEEQKLAEHIKYMANICYGYSKVDIQFMARDLAISLGKNVKSKEKFSNSWFYSFMKRWPDVKSAKPKKLSMARAKSASEESMFNYFEELNEIMSAHNLHQHPERIYNIDETGICTEHNPSKIVCDKDSSAQSVTSPRSSNVTIIACGNAIGNQLPPYYIFPGQRWNDAFLQGTPLGSNGEMSKSGWSNSSIFMNYMTVHFQQYITCTSVNHKILVLFDGHTSHCLLTLTQWAERNNIIPLVLPPHSSHLTQPLDVGVFGPFKRLYSAECQSYMRHNPGISVNKYNVAELSALCAENLTSAFHKAGVYPYNPAVIKPCQLAPATIYSDNHETVPEEPDQSKMPDVPVPSGDVSSTQITSDTLVPSADVSPTQVTLKAQVVHEAKDFFSSRTITKVAIRPKRKFNPPPSVVGNLSKIENISILTVHAEKKLKKEAEQTKNKLTSKSKFESRPSTSGMNEKVMHCLSVIQTLTVKLV